jgi:hypothetical protein
MFWLSALRHRSQLCSPPLKVNVEIFLKVEVVAARLVQDAARTMISRIFGAFDPLPS